MTLVYECDGAETKFTRGIKKDGVGEYRIDGKACKWEAYSARLKSLGVLTQALTGFLPALASLLTSLPPSTSLPPPRSLHLAPLPGRRTRASSSSRSAHRLIPRAPIRKHVLRAAHPPPPLRLYRVAPILLARASSSSLAPS